MLENYTKPAIQPEQPKPRALVIRYKHKNLDKSAKSQEERYKLEGYEVKRILIETESKFVRGGLDRELKDAIEWIKEGSENSLLSFIHHGSADRNVYTKDLKGKFTAQRLADHGLCISDLKKMKIRLLSCGAANQDHQGSEAEDFFEALHKNGAGNFIGDASKAIMGTNIQPELKINQIELKIKEIDNIIKEQKAMLGQAQYRLDYPDQSYNGENSNVFDEELDKDIIEECAKSIQNLQDDREVLVSNKAMYSKLKRGDSFSAFHYQPKSSTGRHASLLKYANKSPRSLDSDGKLITARYFLAPIKSENSKVHLTLDPTEVEKALQSRSVPDFLSSSQVQNGIDASKFSIPLNSSSSSESSVRSETSIKPSNRSSNKHTLR